MYKRVIFWFKRDLRIDDNEGFYQAYKNSLEIIPIFIFIPELLEKFNSYDQRLGFVVECIKHLEKDLKDIKGKLFCYYEAPERVFEYLIGKYQPEAVFTNKAFSYTVEDIESKIEKMCKNKGVRFHSFLNNFLCDIRKIPYKKIFSYFYKYWQNNLNLKIYEKPKEIRVPPIKEPTIKEIMPRLKFLPNNFWKVDFIFSRIEKFDYQSYDELRNRLDIDGSSRFSPYIRFGIISLRKIYQKAFRKARGSQFIKELAWREFWYHIKNYFPEFRDKEFQEKRRNIKWENNEKFIKIFMEGKTGYPIIDAAIRQLKEENWLHNRARMIVASFLTKDLLVDWRIGEEFFMKYLIDYDEVVNIGNWQWNASVGPDPKPLRIFNPIIQARKFDPEAKYIKKYLPELKDLPAYMLFDPLTYKLPYYKPIVNHYERIKLVRKIYLKKFNGKD
ncbi:MAG: deoxyribodipyrimidine photo-lyase [candidate division WOR-3 bacterium]|nr:deoxyribodipyrimidine photo-lyase [candidate division WOR-3 bacterium]